MKRILIFSLILSSAVGTSFAQGEMDAFNLSYSDLSGTAHSASMGGALGALGGDVSAVAVNPAGIGVYKSSEIVTTLNFANTKTKTSLTGISSSDSKFKFDLNNIAVVGTFPIQSDAVPLINFGFAYNGLRSFDRKVSMRGNNLNASLTDNMVNRANSVGYNAINSGFDGTGQWLAVLGYNAGLIQYNNINQRFESVLHQGETVNNNLYMQEKGEISSYDFNVGTTISDILSVGLTVAVTDINYNLYSDYSENFSQGGNFFLENFLKTEGTGWQLKAGMIFKPIQQLRIGVAYHSPTWYQLTDYYNGYLDALGNPKIQATPGDAFTDYKLRTPDKWVFSAAGLIGRTLIISADYELTNYSNMHLANPNGIAYDVDNQNIKEDFKNSSTLRVGAEVNITNQFAVRVGYMWQQSPVRDVLINGSQNANSTSEPHTAATVGTIPQYTLVGDANYFTYGLGYRFTNGIYTDIAFIMMNRKDDLYTFGGSSKTELKNNKFNGLLTLGYRF